MTCWTCNDIADAAYAFAMLHTCSLKLGTLGTRCSVGQQPHVETFMLHAITISSECLFLYKGEVLANSLPLCVCLCQATQMEWPSDRTQEHSESLPPAHEMLVTELYNSRMSERLQNTHKCDVRGRHGILKAWDPHRALMHNRIMREALERIESSQLTNRPS